jgi:hypothetical protein
VGVVSESDLDEDLNYADLELVNVDGFRGRDTGATGLLFEPLRGRVIVGGPHGFLISAERAAKDEGLRKLIADKPGHVDFYKVHLGISFVTHNGPRLESVQLKLSLTADPVNADPFALLIAPAEAGTTVKVKQGARADFKAALPAVGDVAIGADADREYETTRLFVRGLGLGGDRPGWEFTRTVGQRLEGQCRLELVVQVARDARLTVGGVATAQARAGNLLGRFRAELPYPLTFGNRINPR